MILFKSDFAKFLQCPKKVWLTKYGLNNDIKAFDPYLAECGNLVGNRAKDWAKQFIQSSTADSSYEFLRNSGINAVEHTKEHLAQHTPLLFESAFSHNQVYCRTDLLWNQRGRQIIGEVKSSTSVKDQDDAIKRYGLDLAVQLYGMTSVIQEGTIKLDSFQLIFPDEEHSKVGIEGLTFKRIEMLDYISSIQNQVSLMAEEIQEFLSQPYEPNINMGSQCKQNGGCPFQHECREGKFDLLAYELPGFNGNWRKLPKLEKPEYPLEMQTAVKDIPEDLLTLPVFKRVQASERTHQPFFDKDMAVEFLSKYKGPYGYVDFEFATSFPVIAAAGLHIGQRIPFQYVLYIRDSASSSYGEPKNFLNLQDPDPRRKFAESLIEDCEGLKTIFVYNKGAEGGVLKDLIDAFPDISHELNNILETFCDLLEITREAYYHPDMLGSYSLKKVLPTIGITYDDLSIQGGNEAQLQYLYARLAPEKLSVPISETEHHLKEYCGLDTLGMIYLHDFLLTGKGAVAPKEIATRGLKKMQKKDLSTQSADLSTNFKISSASQPFISKWQMIGLIAAIILVWAIFSPIIFHFAGVPKSAGEVGDSFGVVNSLFSALGLAGIILSIVLQQHDLKLTRNEVAESAKAQKESAKALEKQAELHILTTKIQALSVLIESSNHQINQNDRWNLEIGDKKFDNSRLFQKRRQAEAELWKLKEKLEII